jgi:hypothetical protein
MLLHVNQDGDTFWLLGFGLCVACRVALTLCLRKKARSPRSQVGDMFKERRKF